MHISVIIPTFNRAHTLPRALDSVLAQTRPADEIIVIDDGSTDNTRELMQQHYPHVCYRYQDNAGVSVARNHGIRRASGDWIALLDSDDEWLPEKLAKQSALITENPDYMLCHSDEIWIRNGRRVNPMKKHGKAGGWIFDRCLPLCAISPSAAMIRKDLLQEIGLFDETLPACEDYDLWLKICSQQAVLYIAEPLLKKYGGHDDQLSRLHWGMDRFRIIALDNAIQNLSLKPDDRQVAIDTLLEKTRLFVNGAIKRERQDDLAPYHALLKKYGARHD